MPVDLPLPPHTIALYMKVWRISKFYFNFSFTRVPDDTEKSTQIKWYTGARAACERRDLRLFEPSITAQLLPIAHVPGRQVVSISPSHVRLAASVRRQAPNGECDHCVPCWTLCPRWPWATHVPLDLISLLCEKILLLVVVCGWLVWKMVVDKLRTTFSLHFFLYSPYI
jgi:hypothetical protein